MVLVSRNWIWSLKFDYSVLGIRFESVEANFRGSQMKAISERLPIDADHEVFQKHFGG